MKLTFLFLLFVAVSCHGADDRGSRRVKEKTANRGKDNGDESIQKRAPEQEFADVSPSLTPGIQYADDKGTQIDKSPAQQIYATAAPQVAKISDVLTGHGAFPATITGHLVSPVPIYQPRLASPTTYEVSPPVPSRLAYSEHKILYQAPQNAIQYFSNQKLPSQVKQPLARFTVNYNRPPYPEQVRYYQPQVPQIIYSNSQPQLAPHQTNFYSIPQQQVPQPQVVYQQQPQQPLYNQLSVAQPYQNQLQQPLYNNIPVALFHQIQPTISYAKQQELPNSPDTNQNFQQSQLKGNQLQQPNFVNIQGIEKNAGAVSYASFSQSPPAQSSASSDVSHRAIQPQLSLEQRLEQLRQETSSGVGMTSSPPAANPNPAILQKQHPLQRPVLYLRPQQQYQSQQQYQPQQQYQAQQQYQPQQFIQPPLYPQNSQQVLSQNQGEVYQQAPGYSQIQSLQSPSFPNVQYFGKFAENIFGNYQQR